MWPVLWVTHYKQHELCNNITFFQVASKVMHYFLTYLVHLELLCFPIYWLTVHFVNMISVVLD